MKVKHGKYYEDGHGNKRGPIWLGYRVCWVEGQRSHPNPEWDHDGMPTKNGQRNGMTEKDALIAEWTDEPRQFGDLTDAEKVERLSDAMKWQSKRTFIPTFEAQAESLLAKVGAIKTEPVVETVELTGKELAGKGATEFIFSTNRHLSSDTHCLMLPIKDGKPITGTFTNENGDTIKVEKI